jgi:glycosyltransferase involved in cell wall biosynthesis
MTGVDADGPAPSRAIVVAATTAREGGGAVAARAVARWFADNSSAVTFWLPRSFDLGSLPGACDGTVDVVAMSGIGGPVREVLGPSPPVDTFVGMSDRLPLRRRARREVMVAQNPHLYGPRQRRPALEGRAETIRTFAQQGRLMILRAWARHSARRADQVVVATHDMARLVRTKGVTADRIIVRAIPPQDIRLTKLTQHDELESVLLVGTNYGYKRFGWALRQLDAWCAQTGRRLRVTHVGGPPGSLEVIARDCRHLDCVLKGPLPHEQAIGLLAEADLLVFPSERESFGLPLAEALAMGLPVICTDLPVFRELAGPAATYFDDSPGSLGRALDAVVDVAARARQAAAGRGRVAANVGWDVYSSPPPDCGDRQ